MMRSGRLVFAPLIAFVVVCIALDGVQQVWVEWKRLVWGGLGMAVREKIGLTWARVFKLKAT